MGLSFSSLMWIYHDGWRFKQSKTELSADAKGNPIHIDRSKTMYHKGHCHLCIPDMDTSQDATSLAYSGKQEYNFELKDEWGPNSEDPNQNMSVKLIGKPIWYFYIEQYWRRMYIQPWDKVDETCTLPLNQQIVYDKYTYSNYLQIVVDKFNLVDDFNDFFTTKRKEAAMVIWAQQYMVDCTYYSRPYNQNDSSDISQARIKLAGYIANITTINQISNYLNVTRYYKDDSDNYQWKSYNIYEQFNEFYKTNANLYNGYFDKTEALQIFLSTNEKTSSEYNKLSQYKRDENYIYVPEEKTIGHIGIKYDASKACHSLGPFREGGQFYFFNTVVNRTMPCQYWTDENKRVRQYYIKQKNNGEDTTGGGTWTYSDDINHFIWVYNTFDEAQKYLGDDYEVDRNYLNDYTYGINFRLRPNVFNYFNLTNTKYFYALPNSKRIKDDKYIYIKNPRNSQNIWIGNNDKILHNESIQEQTSSSSSSSSSSYSYNEYHWEIDNYWNGFYEKNEIIRCAHDGKWYKRIWAPYLYSSSNIYSDLRLNGYSWYYTGGGERKQLDYPYWNISKIQSFPNPPPWLCDDAMKSSQFNNDEADPEALFENKYNNEFNAQAFVNQDKPFLNGEDNRIHMLHREYLLYYDLVRYYGSKNSYTQNFYYEYTIRGDTAYYLRKALGTTNNDYSDYILQTKRIYTDNTIPYDEFFGRESALQIYFLKTSEYYCGYDFEWNEYQKKIISLDWQTAIEKYYDEYGAITTIQQENECFNDFLQNLPENYSPLSYQDQIVYKYPTYKWENLSGQYAEIPSSYINSQEGTYVHPQTGEILPLPAPTYLICYNSIASNKYESYMGNEYDYRGELYDQFSTEYPTYVTFSQFKKIWRTLTDQELLELKLSGDYPERNDVPYNTYATIDDIYPNLIVSSAIVNSDADLTQDQLKQKEELGFTFSQYISFKRAEYTAKKTVFDKIAGTQAYEIALSSLICSQFYPRIDNEIRSINSERSKSKSENPVDKAPFALSPLDEILNPPSYINTNKNEPIDPFRCNKVTNSVDTSGNSVIERGVNPITTWKKYFTKRQIYTIPQTNVVGGDKSIQNSKGSPNYPLPHPREMSYSVEDGARRLYSDEKYISPIIQYQKIIRANWQRLPQYKQEEQFIEQNWKTDEQGHWGDGFKVSISIPFQLNQEIQSPFSGKDKITQPIGEYFHDCIKPENKFRYHIDFYDSLDKIRQFDFPNYVDLIHEFQAQHLPEGHESPSTYVDQDQQIVTDTSYEDSLYQINLNDPIEDHSNDEDYEQPVDPVSGKTWKYLLQQFWKSKDLQYNFSYTPIIKNKDCYGKDVEENSFVKLKNGKYMWREETTALLPDQDKVEQLISINITYTDEDNIEQMKTIEAPGYINSNNKFVKGGKVVTWNNPYPQAKDGKWVEQCLGAIVKAKVVLILQDNLGYRWKQEVTATSLTSQDSIKGSDYDVGE